MLMREFFLVELVKRVERLLDPISLLAGPMLVSSRYIVLLTVFVICYALLENNLGQPGAMRWQPF